MTHVHEFATLRCLWTLPPLANIAGTIYNKHNLFHQSELGRGVELQNAHIVLLKSPRDVHQLATLSVQLGLGSALVDWYWDATSVRVGHLVIDSSPRRDYRLRYCTNSGNIPTKF